MNAQRHRTFATGATRNLDNSKPDYEGFLSPLVVEEFGRYMHGKRFMEDGTLRASDNWQKGIPLDSYVKSGFRHFVDWWTCHRRRTPGPNPALREALTALFFNVQGYLHELLKEQLAWEQAHAASAKYPSAAHAVAMLEDPSPVIARLVTVQSHDDLHNNHWFRSDEGGGP